MVMTDIKAPALSATELEHLNTAKIMANIFENGSKEHVMTPEAYASLQEVFEQVPEARRAAVYLKFVEQLEQRNIPFKNEQAKAKGS